MMVAIGIIAALIVMYVLLAPKETQREYETYCTMECVANRHHNNRICYMQYK